VSTSSSMFGILLLTGVLVFLGSDGVRAQSASSGAVSFALGGNRIYAHMEFITPQGKPRKALVFVDLGSPAMILSKDLYAELNIGSSKTVGLRIGKMDIDVESAGLTSEDWLPFSIGEHRKVEGLLPASILQYYQVRFDYAARTMTLARPATFKLQGMAIPFRINPKTGLIAVDATIDGQTHPMTIDNGSGYTWIRKSVAQDWFPRHPDWQRGIGAVGPSNMRMANDGIEATGTLLRIPEIKLGSLLIEQAGALAIAPDDQGHDFMDWYSAKNAVPVIGWLGGNVLRHFRITVDYPQRISYWEYQSALDSHDLDYVGLTLLFKDGEYFVAAIAARNAQPTVMGAKVGDKLVRIGALKTRGASREAVFAAMHGMAGEKRSLVLEREGARVKVQTCVTGF
jgi:hypothetical protein